MFMRDCEMAQKRKLYPARLRFTINEASGAALADPTMLLSHYINEPMWLSEGTVTLYFKDLGP